jgi:hypothetical protein
VLSASSWASLHQKVPGSDKKSVRKGSVVLWIDVINEGAPDEQVAWLKVDQLHPEATWLDSGFGEDM